MPSDHRNAPGLRTTARCALGSLCGGPRRVAGFFVSGCCMVKKANPKTIEAWDRLDRLTSGQLTADDIAQDPVTLPPAKISKPRPRRSPEAMKRRRKARNAKRGRVCYRDYIPSRAWKQKRKKAFKHYGRICAVCGATGGPLYVHHKTYRNLGHEPMEDLQILCLHCHEDQHADKVLPSDPISQQFREIVSV